MYLSTLKYMHSVIQSNWPQSVLFLVRVGHVLGAKFEVKFGISDLLFNKSHQFFPRVKSAETAFDKNKAGRTIFCQTSFGRPIDFLTGKLASSTRGAVFRVRNLARPPFRFPFRRRLFPRETQKQAICFRSPRDLIIKMTFVMTYCPAAKERKVLHKTVIKQKFSFLRGVGDQRPR